MRVIEERTPIDELLQEQQRLRTPVVDFSACHDRLGTPELEPVYRDLIPLSRPGPGEQYAFEVNMDACTGCKACVTGCHSMNGLEDHETWRDVGLIHSRIGQPYQQTITSACHHCVEPACMHGCPVLAYEKEAETGIVLHLDDQCIGCQYCVLKCPYDVPKYSEFLGIVRKCDMCHGRLAESEAPACVQACPTSAISITIVDTAAVRRKALRSEFLPGAPEPSYTVPTSKYIGNREVPSNAIAADASELEPQPAHLPLVLMLVFTQMALGCFAASLFQSSTPLVLGGLVSLFAGIAASISHLGRPMGAWRSFLGLKRSWLSREIVVFGLLLPIASGYAVFPASAVLGWVTTFLCGVGVSCSVMIYADTRRPFWAVGWSGLRFFGTAVVLGTSCWMLAAPSTQSTAVPVLMAAVALKLGLEVLQTKAIRFLKSRQLIVGPLIGMARARFVLGGVGGLLLPILVLYAGTAEGTLTLVWLGVFLLLLAECFERTLFFQAVEAPRMPRGGVR